MDENLKTGYPALDRALPALLGYPFPPLSSWWMFSCAVATDADSVARDLLRLARNGLPAVKVAEAVARFADSVREARELVSVAVLSRETAQKAMRETVHGGDDALGGRAAAMLEAMLAATPPPSRSARSPASLRLKGAAKSPAKTKGGRARRRREEGREADNGKRH